MINIRDTLIDLQMEIDVTATKIVTHPATEETHDRIRAERFARRRLDRYDLVGFKSHYAATLSRVCTLAFAFR